MSIAIELVYGIWVVPDVVPLGGVSTMLSETRTLHYTPKHAILLFQIYAGCHMKQLLLLSVPTVSIKSGQHFKYSIRWMEQDTQHAKNGLLREGWIYKIPRPC